MTDFGAPKFAVVGCRQCHTLWVIDRHDDSNHAECPRCTHRRPRAKLEDLHTADTLAAAQDLRAKRLAKNATGTDGAQTFGVDDADTFQEIRERVDGITVSEALAQRLEDETDLDAAELDADNRLRRDPDHEGLRVPGQPRLDLDVQSETTREAVLRALVESSMDPDTLVRSNDAALERAGIDPEYVHERAEQLLNEEPDEATEPRPSSQDVAGLRLTHRDDIPATADVVLNDVGPRLREWLDEWTEQALPETAETVLDLVREHNPGAVKSKRLPRTLKTTLQAEYGITAQDGLYAEAIAEYAVDYVHGVTFGNYSASMEQRRRERLRSTILGVGTPGAEQYNGVDDFARGPVSALGYRDDPITTVVHLDADAWLDLDDRATGKRALTTLSAIAESSRVYLGYDSLLLLEELSKRYGDHLEMAGIDLTQTRDAALRRCAESAPNVSGTDAERVYKWVRGVRDDTQPVRLVAALARAPQQTLTRSEILADPEVGIDENSFYTVKDGLVNADLVEWHSRRGSDQSSRLSLTAAGELAAAYITGDYGLRDPLRSSLRTRLTAHHISDAGAVGSRAEDSGRGDPGTAPRSDGVAGLETATASEDWLAAASSTGFAEESMPQYVHWLTGPGGALGAYGMHRRHTAAVTQPGVHLVDERISEWNGRDDQQLGDGRSTFVSDLEIRDGEFLAIAQASLDPLITLGRLANALLTPRVTTSVLSEAEVGREFEQLYDGAWQDLEDVESVGELHGLLRDAAQVGWKGDEQRTVEDLRRRFGGLRVRLNQEVARCSGLNPGDPDREELFKDLQGAIASMTQLLFASGRDVVFNLRVPQTYDLITDELYRRDFLDFLEYTVPKQAVYQSPTGWHSWTRQTQEERPEKLKWRRSPGIEDDYPTADLTASWVLTGPSMTDLVDDVRRSVDAGVRERSDGKRAPPALEVPVRDATQPHVLAEVIEEIAGEKDYKVANTAVSGYDDYDFNEAELAIDEGRADDVTRLLRVFLAALATEDRPLAASPHHVTEALLHISASTKSDDHLRVRDVEHGLAHLPPEVLFPSLGPVATSIVQELLKADEPLLPSEAMERSISEASTMRTWEENREELLALGIVEERASGRNQHYTATLEPWWAPSRSASRPPNVSESMVAGDHEHQMLFEISCELGLDVDDELFLWTDEGLPNVEGIYDASDALRRWRPLLAAAFAGREDLLDVPPPARAREIVVIGRYPDRADTPWYALDEPRESLENPLYTDTETGAKSQYGD